ncbi:unknown [Prevotella sp. CAG:755]|nr:unknown [Prevotella sp. CAG:755]
MLDTNIKASSTYSTALDRNQAMPSWCVEKPPVAVVDMAWFTASNGPMPASQRLTAQAVVKTR